MTIQYRSVTRADIPSLAQLRSLSWGEEDYWISRILAYMEGKQHPQRALLQRVLYAAADGENIIGFIAGHLTQRLNCEGELEWIDVAPAYRRQGIATELVRLLAKWFDGQGANKVCVDPGNDNARKFYASLGAESLNAHWIYWRDISKVIKNPQIP